jgi:branched-chain amino acid transport system permease protein
VVMGYTGQVSLGHIFFLGLGAYITAYGVTEGWNIVLVFVLACLVPAVAGLLVALAAARLGGLAIAMVTVALPIVGVPLAKRLSDFTGGSQGLSTAFARAPAWTGLFDDQWQLYLVLVIGGVVFLLTRNLVRGRYARAFAIVKGNENVASSMGISPYRYKVLAFTIASLIGGVSGFLYMVLAQFTSPETMSFGHSIELVAAMVIGGSASIVGSILGGAFYVLVPQLTNLFDASLTALLQGAILLVVLFVLPGGLVSLPRALTRGRRRPRAERGPAAPPTTPSSTTGSGTAAEQPETERQGHA